MLVIEDGTGNPNAMSYVTVGALQAAALQRGITLPATDEEQEVLLIKAMDYMQSLNYQGLRYSKEQNLKWPRVGVVIDGFYYDYDELPEQLLRGQTQLAFDAMTVDLQPTVTPSPTGAVIEQTVVGAVSVKYANPHSIDGDTAAGVVLSKAMAILEPLLTGYALNVPVRRV